MDNCSVDDTRETVSALSRRDERVVYAFEGKLGLSAARNAGVRLARGDLIAYTDDDAIPSSDWLERIVEIFDTVKPRPALVGGEIEPLWGGPRPPWLEGDFVRLLAACLGWSNHPVFLDLKNAFICEANCAYPKRILEQYGPWPETLGRIGSFLLSNENAINAKIFEREKFVYFDPQVLVRHHIHADRLNLQWFARRCFWQGVSFALIEQGSDEAVTSRPYDLGLGLADTLKGVDCTLDENRPKHEIHEVLSRFQHLGLMCQRLGLVMEATCAAPGV